MPLLVNPETEVKVPEAGVYWRLDKVASIDLTVNVAALLFVVLVTPLRVLVSTARY